MGVTLVRALGALVPASLLFSDSMILFFRGKSTWSFVQVLGAGCVVVVVLTHVCDALHWLPWCAGDISIASVITSIYRVEFLASRCFPSDICFIHSKNGEADVT